VDDTAQETARSVVTWVASRWSIYLTKLARSEDSFMTKPIERRKAT
jgi:hypothetical protein